jgi:hypothetical protein
MGELTAFKNSFSLESCISFVSVRVEGGASLPTKTILKSTLEENYSEDTALNYYEVFQKLVLERNAFRYLDIKREDWRYIEYCWKRFDALLTNFWELPFRAVVVDGLHMKLGKHYDKYYNADCGVYSIQEYYERAHGENVPMMEIRELYKEITCDHHGLEDDEKRLLAPICGESDKDILENAMKACNIKDFGIYRDKIVFTEDNLVFLDDNRDLRVTASGALNCDGTLLQATAALLEHRTGVSGANLELITTNTLIRRRMCMDLSVGTYYLVENRRQLVLCWFEDDTDLSRLPNIGMEEEEEEKNYLSASTPSPSKRSSSGEWRPFRNPPVYTNRHMRYLSRNVVQLIAEKCLPGIIGSSMQYTMGKKFEYPLPGGKLDENLILLVSSTQNGKTNSMISMIWLGFFMYGFGTVYFVRNSVEEYSAMHNSISEFNKALKKWLEDHCEDECYRGVLGAGGYDPSDYLIYCVTQQDANATQVTERHFFSNEELTKLKCVVRCKVR